MGGIRLLLPLDDSAHDNASGGVNQACQLLQGFLHVPPGGGRRVEAHQHRALCGTVRAVGAGGTGETGGIGTARVAGRGAACGGGGDRAGTRAGARAGVEVEVGLGVSVEAPVAMLVYVVLLILHQLPEQLP